MRTILLNCFCLLLAVLPLSARTWYVAVDGNDEASGSFESPLATPNKAVELVQPGDTIFLRGGTYMLQTTVRVKAKQCARADARIYMWAYQEPGKAPEVPILDGSQIPSSSVNEFKMSRCIYHNHEANYWHYKGLTLCNANDNGMKLEGSFNIVENCVFYGNNDTGLQIGMYKDFSIEETKGFDISGEPPFNPGYTYCRHNVILNCDSYYNDDVRSFSGSDDGGDADGFACKLFPGPGTEFYHCRAWNNSDDNWDLYMVYHPVVIDHCWSYKGGYNKDGQSRGNGNGFKLGGGGSSGGAAFSQSVGAHLVRNCVSFGCLAKGFDQNNAYEGMYLFNNLAFDNAYNYRFPTVVKYGTMHLVNNIGFLPGNKNHEFLSKDKAGYVEPDAAHNSWTVLDNCDLIKEGNKVDGVSTKTKDYSNEFLSLAVADFMVDRLPDGSLPKNAFARIKEGSVMVDKGLPITDYDMPSAIPDGVSLPSLSIPYAGAAPDFGPYELGDPDFAKLISSDNLHQRVFLSDSIQPILFHYLGDGVIGVEVSQLPEGLTAYLDTERKTFLISGYPTTSGEFIVSTVGGQVNAQLKGSISLADEPLAKLELISGNLTQTIVRGDFIEHIVFQWGGGTQTVQVERMSEGLSATINTENKTLTIHGQPRHDASFSLHTVGGDGTIDIQGQIYLKSPSQIIANGYPFQEMELPDSLKPYVSYVDASIDMEFNDANGLGSKSALRLNKGTGALLLDFPNGIAKLEFIFHITGSRQLTVKYGPNGTENTWSSGNSKSISKGSYRYDLVQMIPALASTRPTKVQLINSRSDGGSFNIHDLWMATYKEVDYAETDPQGKPEGEDLAPIHTALEALSYSMPDVYVTESAVVVYGEIEALAAYTLSGIKVAENRYSKLLPTSGLQSGIYLLAIKTRDGQLHYTKVRLP